LILQRKYRCCKEQKREKQARYFIECEKKLQEHFEVIKSEMALLIENEALKLDNERMKPTSEFVDIVLTRLR
jgi:hypothetical protein